MDDDLARLRRMLATPETSWLLPRLRERLERNGELTGTITKSVATNAERTAAARLLGRPVRAGQAASISLDSLDDRLRRSGAWPDGLASAVVALTGPVETPAARRAERDAWLSATAILHELAARRPEVGEWVAGVVRAGSLKRAARDPASAQALAVRLTAIAAALPAAGESLGVFAARVADDAHSLDGGTALGSLAAAMAAQLGHSGSTSTPGSARWRRDAWQSVGVIVDELSSTVLALALPGGSTSPTSRALAALQTAGQPASLTLRQLMADPVGVVPDVVHVCENPAVVAAAADRWGSSSLPLVCISGQPGAAAILLLQALHVGGATLRYHGDFDWGGIAIARTLARNVPWQPWRFTAADYDDACSTLDELPSLRGPAVDAPWDTVLAVSMASIGLKVEEELVLGTLLDDLAG